MSQTLHFLPWLRRGLGLTLTNADRGRGALPRSVPIGVKVQVDDDTATATLALRPLDHAVGIDTQQVVRRYPAASSVDAEYGYFPAVDLAAPDLPWLLTPAAPAADTARLRPWLVLVCVEDATAQLTPASPDRPARLSVSSEQLPDLTESHAWAHVQSAVQPGSVVSSLSEMPGAVIARLVCPRRLAPSTHYRLAIVAAFKAIGDELHPAWAIGEGAVDLTVYDTWTVATGEASSFEELCERLEPVEDSRLELGLHTTDVTELGTIEPWPEGTERVTVDFEGALRDVGTSRRTLGRLADDFAGPVAACLAVSDPHVTLDLGDPDPVVTPPFYGCHAAVADSVPNTGWLRELNLDPAWRMAAGLGARIVRLHQERFMAMAWRQVGQLRETNRQLSLARLQAEMGRTWLARAERLDPQQRVAVLRPQLSFVRDDAGAAPRLSLLQSSFPNGLVSSTYLRLSRPGAVMATAAARRNPEMHAWHASLAVAFGSDATREELGFAKIRAPGGLRFHDSRDALDAPPEDDEPDPEEPWEPDGPLPTGRRSRARAAAARPSFELEATAGLLRDRITPLMTCRARIQARCAGLVAALEGAPADELPSRVAVGPVIDEALVWSLAALSAELVLPGVERFPENAVRIVEANPAFVAAILGGANHEMARELLWREFPADMAATTFRRFWDRPDPAAFDIRPMADWRSHQALTQVGSSGGVPLVVLIRGDVVRHYPSLRVLLVDPTTNIASLPAFGGWLPPDVRFMAFDVSDVDAVTAAGSRWKLALEEQPSEPRFGLDTATPADGGADLSSWNDLSWQHLEHQTGSHLVIEGALPAGTTLEGATWGLNAAHMARATYQAPFRVTFPVRELIGGSR